MRRFPLTLTITLALTFTFTFTRTGAEEPLDAGASISVTVTDGGDTTIEVRNGELKVHAGGEETRVSAGQGVSVRKGQKAKKLSLLPAPMPQLPPDGDHVNTVNVPLQWARVERAKRYKVSIAQDIDFEKLHHEPASVGEVKWTVQLPAGTYFWHVQAVDKDGLEGKPSPPQKFTVDVTPPKLKPGKPKWQ